MSLIPVDILTSGARIGIVGAGAFLLCGMTLGVWKFAHMRKPPNHTSPIYVDIAHRAALMYAFAALVLGALAQFSVWPSHVNTVAVAVNLLFFTSAVGAYVVHGFRQTEHTQYRDSNLITTWGTWALIAGELAGTATLLVGVILA